MRNTLFLLIVAVALAGCAAETPKSTAGLGKLEIHPSMDSVFTNKSVGFKLVDATTGKSVKGAWWGIVSPHNVPGDRASCTPMDVTPPRAWLPTRPPSG